MSNEDQNIDITNFAPGMKKDQLWDILKTRYSYFIATNAIMTRRMSDHVFDVSEPKDKNGQSTITITVSKFVKMLGDPRFPGGQEGRQGVKDWQ